MSIYWFKQDFRQKLIIQLLDHSCYRSIPVVSEPFNLFVAVAAPCHRREVGDVVRVTQAVVGSEVFVHGEQLLTAG